MSRYRTTVSTPFKTECLDTIATEGNLQQLVNNVFASPWKDSDVVLVVGKTKFHVHRSILTLQSPVFKAMLNGRFKESSQKKITLEGKTSEDMLQFLKLLYPPNMVKKPLISLSGENAFKILVLADEYQAEDVINQCLEEVKVTAENAFRVFPYASKYNQSVREKCVEVIKRSVSTKKVEEEFSKLDNEVIKELLLTKCRFLESVARRGNEVIITSLDKLLETEGNPTTASASAACNHSVSVRDFRQARDCEHCLKSYENNFADKFVYVIHNHSQYVGRLNQSKNQQYCRSGGYSSQASVNSGQKLVDLLNDTDDVTKSTTSEQD